MKTHFVRFVSRFAIVSLLLAGALPPQVISAQLQDLGLENAEINAGLDSAPLRNGVPFPKGLIFLQSLADTPIAGLALANDSPTVLGSPTTLTATVTAGTAITYAWDWGDDSGTSFAYSSEEGLGLTIPDNGCGGGNYLEHTLTVTEPGVILDVDVTIADLRHAWDADLRIYLRGPDGTHVELSTSNGGNGDDYYNAVFDDEAGTPITSGFPPFTGLFRPEGALASFDGTNRQGEWTLRICDGGPTIEGTLNKWALSILTVPPTTSGVITHTYPAAGAYTATVLALNAANWATAATTVVVKSVMADFSANPTSGVCPMVVTFTNRSGGDYTAALWDLGDGNASTLPHPTHTYTVAGVYTVSLTVNGPGGTDSLTRPGYIAVADPPAAVHLSGPQTGFVGTAYAFSATVSPISAAQPITYLWEAAGLSPVTHTGALSDTIVFTWSVPRTKAVTVTIASDGGAISATQLITIADVPIAGLTLANDSPTLLGNPTLLAAAVVSGTNIIYAWTWGDETGITFTYPSENNMGLAIPDNGCGGGDYLEHTIIVTEPGVILDVDVTIADLRHDWDADLRIYVRGPDGTQVELSTGNGEDGDNYYNTVFDDEASTPITSGTAPFTGRFQPEGDLSAFDGRDQPGEWTLRICDGGAAVEGTLNEWKLSILTVPPTTSSFITHTYPALGIYTATVLARNSANQLVATTTVAIKSLVADFTASPPSGAHPLTVTFTNRSTGPYTASVWHFGGGVTSTLPSPTHTYTATGVYAVSLTVTGAGESDTTTRYVTVTEVLPLIVGPGAVTIGGPQAGFAGAAYDFSATVSPISATCPITYLWEAAGHSPVTHTGGLSDTTAFTWGAPGIKMVTVTATNVGGVLSGAVSATHLITIADAPIAGLSLVNDSPTLLGSPTVLTAAVTAGTNITYAWDWGEGAGFTTTYPSGSQLRGVVTHTYPAAGVYTAAVLARNSVNWVTATTTVAIKSIVANFTANPLLGAHPLTVTFTNHSTGPYTASLWDFGDGETSVLASPTHTYATTGVYTVSLTVTGVDESDTLTRTRYITVQHPVQADFSANPTSGAYPLTVAFTNWSTGLYTASRWDFGDGGTSVLPSPTHTYPAAGVYTVSLTVTGPDGSDALTRARYIVVYTPAKADFSASPTSGMWPLLVQFTNQSSGDYTTSLWDFGDGATSMVAQPAHTYMADGVYTASLTVSGLGGNHTLARPSYITVGGGAHTYLPFVVKDWPPEPMRLYLHMGDASPSQFLSLNQQGGVYKRVEFGGYNEWSMKLDRDLVGAAYAYTIYASRAYYSTGGAVCDVEVLLRRSGSEVVLARWFQAFTTTNSYTATAYSGRITGIDPNAQAGDSLVLRIYAYNQPVTIWMDKQEDGNGGSSSIQVPSYAPPTGTRSASERRSIRP
ncbi:MAG: PKD domain-containing protein [Thermoflexales bacterium]|nr:PKD domain-containing protein [Thermoflexales bacterium]